MSILLWVAFCLHLAYALLVWRLGGALAGSLRLEARRRSQSPIPTPAEGSELDGISVLIAARNEEEWLPRTLAALAGQSLDHGLWEVLVVDDQSRDGSAEAARVSLAELAGRGIRGRLLHTMAGHDGKKAALALGFREARHAWVAVLDADCRPGADWLATLHASARPDTGLLAGPVVFTGEGLFARIARLEYMGLLGAGLASFALGRPLFASGANLCTRRAAFHEAGGYQGLEHIASADDTLLIQRLRQRTRWGLAALLDPGAMVQTRAPSGPVGFWRQRVRWTSTERHMPDPAARAAALGLYAVFLGCLMAPVAVLLGWIPPLAAASLVLLKLVPDSRLVHRAAARLGGRRLLPLFPLAWLGQLAYGLLAPWAGTFGRVRWREPATVALPRGTAR